MLSAPHPCSLVINDPHQASCITAGLIFALIITFLASCRSSDPGDDGGVSSDGSVSSDGARFDGGGPATPQPESAPLCNDSGWCIEQACPAPTTFTALWGLSPRSIFAVDDLGWIYHFNGARWSISTRTERKDSFDQGLQGIWGSAEDDVFAVGDRRAYHYDGTMWLKLEVPIQSISAVWGSGPDNVYITGGDELSRFDGSEWRAVEVPGGWQVTRFWGSGPNDIYAVGAGVYHFDGGAWTKVLDKDRMVAIWGSGPSDIYAVRNIFSGDADAIYHYDGKSWETSAGPFDKHGYTDIWGSGPDDIYAVGPLAKVTHFDGSSWSEFSPETVWPRASMIWGTARDHLIMLGERQLTRFDGAGWRSCSSVLAPLDLKAVWGPGAGNFVVAGRTAGQHIATAGGGNGWSEFDAEHSFPDTVEGIWGTSLADFHAVGLSDLKGAMVHYEGSPYPESQQDDEHFIAIWGAAADNIYAVKQDMNVLRYDGTQWQEIEWISSQHIGGGVWGSGPNDIYVVGGQGSQARVLHFDGLDWGPSLPGGASIARPLAAVWGSDPADIFAVGLGGDIIHYDGQTWSAMSSGTTSSLTAIWGSGPSDVYAAGLRGALLHYDGAAWTPQDSGTDNDLHALWGSGPDEVVAVGAKGTIVRYHR